MIRLLQRKLIIPRGDTGSFTIPAIAATSHADVAVFTIFDCLTHTKVCEDKIAAPINNSFTFVFTHNETVNMKPGKYFWDIKFYKNPVYADGKLVNGEEIDSYYAGYTLPECEIRETGDDLLISPDAPSGTLTPAQLNVISAALAELSHAVAQTETNVSHYPQIREEEWYVWDAITNDYVATGVAANGIVGPAGNGISSIVKSSTSGYVDTYTINFTDGSSTTFTVTNGESGVYVGTSTPTSPNTVVWIDPSGDASGLDGFATKANTVLDTTLSRGRKAGTTIGTGSFAFGNNVEASGNYSHAEGGLSVASGTCSHAEGIAGTTPVTASGVGAHAEGSATTASGRTSHAEGFKTSAIGENSHAEGKETIANGESSHVGGIWNVGDSLASWTEWVASTSYEVGDKVKVTTTANNETVVQGYICKTANSDSTFDSSKWATDNYMNFAEIIGNGTSNNARSNARALDWNGNEYLAGDVYVGCNSDSTGGTKLATVTDVSAKADKADTVLDTTLSRGRKENTIVGNGSFAFGDNVTAMGAYSHAEGVNTTAAGVESHAEGFGTAASDTTAHAEGYNTTASGKYSHAEGSGNIASGQAAHAEGTTNTASGIGSHVEGQRSFAVGNYSHAEGGGTVANGLGAHAEGAITYANGNGSHAEGNRTIANGTAQHSGGRFNVADSISSWPEWIASTSYAVGDKVKITATVDNETTVTGYVCKTANSDAEFTVTNWTKDTYMNYAEIIGNGATENTRSNARALSWEGNEYLMGDIYVHANADSSGGTRVPHDIQINGTSIVSNGVANIPLGSSQVYGALMAQHGLTTFEGKISVATPTDAQFRQGNLANSASVLSKQHLSAFYGLAKAAGADMKDIASATVGIYPEAQKSAISQMLNSHVSISGTTPTITALPGISYLCGEVSTLAITLPASGCIDVVFESGSTPTVLTITPPSGVTVRWTNGFDPTSLEADTIYEINIADGLGVAASWT